MSRASTILLVTLLGACSDQNYVSTEVYEATVFATYSCNSVLSPLEAASQIESVAAFDQFSSELGETIVGPKGIVLTVGASDPSVSQTQVFITYFDDFETVQVWASKPVAPTDQDRRLISALLDATQLENCMAVTFEELLENVR